MENQGLVSCKDAFVRIASEGTKFCRKYEKRSPELKELANDFDIYLQEKLNDFNPKIMIYGIYNSGKSTIMNALMGELKAAMADVPTTDKIDEYRWKEYTIYDTPGINAPKEHEKVSKEFLKKCDVIIFVMDTEGSFSLGKNFRELVEIIHSGKRLLIVLNNKSGFDQSKPHDVAEVNKIKQKIYEDFADIYSKEIGEITPEQLAEKVKFVIVDAASALSARTDKEHSEQDKEELLNLSNITALEDAIVAEYGRTTGFTILRQLEVQLREIFDELSKVLQEDKNDELTKQAKKAQVELLEIQEQLTDKVADYARDTANELAEEIYSIFTSEKDEGEVVGRVDAAAQEWVQRVNLYMGEEIKKIAIRVDNIIADFNESVKVNVGDVNIPGTVPNAAALDVLGKDLSLEGNKAGEKDDLSTPKAVAAGAALQYSVKAIMPVIANIPWIGPVVAKVLGPFVPVIGPLIVAWSLVSPFFGKSDAEKQVEAEMAEARRQEEALRRQQEEIARYKQEMKDESQRISRKMILGILDEIRKIISASFDPAVKSVKDTIAKYREESSAVMNDLSIINDLKKELKEKVTDFRIRSEDSTLS